MTNAEALPAAVLERKAVVYVRQSTPAQVEANLESRRRQYELVEVARRRGFRAVEVIDDDLGRLGQAAWSPGPASNGSSLHSALARLARCCASTPRASRATGGTGITCSSSAASSRRGSSTSMASTTPAVRTTASCWA